MTLYCFRHVLTGQVWICIRDHKTQRFFRTMRDRGGDFIIAGPYAWPVSEFEEFIWGNQVRYVTVHVRRYSE